MLIKVKICLYISCLALAFGLTVVNPADAHVVVTPTSSTTGNWELYSVKVPVEKTSPTTKVKLAIPPELTFEQYEPVPGWSVTFEKDNTGRIQAVTWTAIGGGILPNQFEEFKFIGQNPKAPAKVAWNAYQYYKDGSVVEWTKNPGEDTPHSATNIVAGHVMSDGTIMADDMMPPETTHKSGTDPNVSVAIWLSSISIVISAIALLLAIRGLRSKQ